MALKDTCKTLKSLLETIHSDLDKAEAGNKAAAQRVRTLSIKFEKTAKLYRKESIKADKSGLMKKAKEASRKKPASKKPAAKPTKQVQKPTPKQAPKQAAKPAPKQAPKPAAKPAAKKRAPAKKVATAKKRPTAKLPKAGRRKK